MLKSKTVPTNEQPTYHLRWANIPQGEGSNQSGMGFRREGFLDKEMLELRFQGNVSYHSGEAGRTRQSKLTAREAGY